MSANNIYTHSAGEYNFYSIAAENKKYIIGGVPPEYKDSYIAEASTASALVLLTSNPEFCGGVGELVARNPQIEIYATAAGLRNIKEIINCEINEKLIKDSLEIDGITFFVSPNLAWVDTAMAVYDKTLFSGQLFSGVNKSEYYNNILSVNRTFVISATERVKSMGINSIYPAIGTIDNVSDIIAEYDKLTAVQPKSKPLVCIIYSSKFGYTKALAEYARDMLDDKTEVYFSEATDADIKILNKADALIIGTNTLNRNAPESIWRTITQLDLVNMRQTPYFVFGSFGWAADGVKLTDKTLFAMGMKQIVKPVEVLFAPTENDFTQIAKAVNKLQKEISD